MKIFKITLIGILTAFAACTTTVEPLDPSIVVPDPNNIPAPGPATGTTGWSNVPFPANAAAIFSSAVDGVTLTATDAFAVKTVDVSTIPAGGALIINYLIVGNASNKSTILQFQDQGVTAYLLQQPNPNIASFNEVFSATAVDTYTTLNLANPDEQHGTITLTANNTSDKRLAGTFNAKTYKLVQPPATQTTRNLTNGVFNNIEYLTYQTNNVFKYKIGSVQYPLAGDEAVMTGIFQKNASQWLKIVDGNEENVMFGLKNDLPVGTYTFSLNAADLINGYYKINDVLFKATSGTITVATNSSSRIAGSFSFTASNAAGTQTYVISNGEFSLAK